MKNNLLSEKLVFNGDSVAPTRLRLCSYDANEMSLWEGCSADELETQLVQKRINWLQVCGFSDTETIRRICTFFGIDFLVMQDILNTEHLSKVEEHDTYNLIIAKQITADDVLHIGIVQGETFVLTFQERSNGFFDDVIQAIRSNALKFRSRQSDYLLTVLMNSIAANYMSVARNIGDDLDDLESELLSSTVDRDIGIQIQTLRRRYMVLKRTAIPLREQYQRMIRGDSPLIHKANRVFNALLAHGPLYLQQRPSDERHHEAPDDRIDDIHPPYIPCGRMGHELQVHAGTRMALRISGGMGRDDCNRSGGVSVLPDPEMEIDKTGEAAPLPFYPYSMRRR